MKKKIETLKELGEVISHLKVYRMAKDAAKNPKWGLSDMLEYFKNDWVKNRVLEAGLKLHKDFDYDQLVRRIKKRALIYQH